MSKKGGHHGGAWKVAYADFVTAMMALFMVLWLAAQDQKIKEAVERAFRNPFMSMTKESSGLMPTKQNSSSRSGGGKFDTASASQAEVSMLRRLHQDLSKNLTKSQGQGGISDDEQTVEFNLSSEGLRITVFDRAQKPIFQPDSDHLTEYGRWILTTLAWEISRYATFAVELEGHTESGHETKKPEYGGWELSADRANAGRRTLIEHGVRPDQIRKVAGFADTVPISAKNPSDVANRRITLLLRVQGDKEEQSPKTTLQ